MQIKSSFEMTLNLLRYYIILKMYCKQKSSKIHNLMLKQRSNKKKARLTFLTSVL